MIIGINGKIGSGKDTVGRIIQYLTSEYRDKYSFVEWRDRVENYNSNTYSPWEIKKFAGKLKTMASLLTGIPVEKFEDQEFKKTNLSDEWSYLQQSGRSKVWIPMTVRELLQKLGTEAMREGLHTNVWVNALFADYKTIIYREETKIWETPISKWIITDMRFPNEMEAIVARGGITIRVVRPDMNSLQAMVPAHASETALDDHTMHYEIINDGTIEDLIEKVREILIERNII